MYFFFPAAQVFFFLRYRHQERIYKKLIQPGGGLGVSDGRVSSAGMGRSRLPPASVWPVAARRVGGGSWKRRPALTTGAPPALARPAADVSGGEGRWCVAAGVCTVGGADWARRAAAGFGMVGGGSACWRGRQTKETCTCFCAAAGVGQTCGGRVGRGGALVSRRRRLYGRRRRLSEAGCRRLWYGRRRPCV